MAYIGNQPTTVAFLTDQFSGTGSQTAFTLSAAPANTASILVAVSGVLQDPSTYSVSGTTLTFSAAPPSGTGNISVRFLGIPASGVVTTAYRTQTEFTATAGQTTFTPPSYTVGFIDVYRNGVLLGSADFTATNGTTVVLATGATAGDLIETISFSVSSVLNAIPATAGAVNDTYIQSGAVLPAKISTGGPSWTSGGDLSFNSGYGSVATAYGCRAWVNFNGTGTVAIRASGNVTSLTDNNVGDYTINLTTAMPDANYEVNGVVRNTQTYAQVQIAAVSIAQSTAPTTSALRITTTSVGDTGARANIDSDYVCVSIFR